MVAGRSYNKQTTVSLTGIAQGHVALRGPIAEGGTNNHPNAAPTFKTVRMTQQLEYTRSDSDADTVCTDSDTDNVTALTVTQTVSAPSMPQVCIIYSNHLEVLRKCCWLS